ncbi:MAG: PIN domain-containing protein, partial [bacterium]
MTYIALDTCVWLGLIKIDLHNDNNVFEEICYWIENKYIIHITPENIIREWDRNKAKKLIEISNDIKRLNNTIITSFRGTSDLVSAYQPETIEEIISKRIDRVETILKVHSEIANETQTIYDDAIKRNFNCLAPNHTDDSFRDTINIFTIINHIKTNGYTNCIFSTINYADFSEGKTKKHDLHNQLIDDFDNANLQYVYCDEEPFGSKLLGVHLRPSLPSFQDFLMEKKRQEEEKIVEERKINDTPKIDSPDADYLENIKHLDMIFAKKTPTSFEQELVKLLINIHVSYNQYFFKN